MSNHKILLNYTFDMVVVRANEVSPRVEAIQTLVGVGTVRRFVREFETFSKKDDIFILDVKAFNDDMFAPFLKVLEESSGGSIWFFGIDLSMYPLTIKSRCAVETYLSASVEQVRKFLMGRGEQHDLSDMLHLTHYGMENAHEMVKRKEEIIDFFITLDSTRTLEAVQHDIMRFDRHHFNLLLEWMHSNDIFTERELKLCEFLRSKRFRTRLGLFSTLQGDALPETTFLSAFLCKMLEE